VSSPPDLQRPASPTELFTTFTWIALQGFGGVLAIIQRELCERKRWLTQTQFVELFALCQVLPGPNVINLSLVMGDRFFGWRGALAAVTGMILMPLILVLAITMVYVHYATNPVVAGALRGMGAVAAGLIFGTAVKLGKTIRDNVMGLPACIGLVVAAFVSVALLHLPLVWVLAVLGALACLIAWWRLGIEEARSPS
jgi:chromate transporter